MFHAFKRSTLKNKLLQNDIRFFFSVISFFLLLFNDVFIPLIRLG